MLKTYKEKMELLDTEFTKYKGDVEGFYDLIYRKYYERSNISQQICSADVQEYLKVWRKDKTQEERKTSTNETPLLSDIYLPFKTTGNNLLKKDVYIIELIESGKSPKEAKGMLEDGIAKGIFEDKGDGYIYCWVNK